MANRSVSFVVPMAAVGQPRQRHALIGGHVRNYTPANAPVNAFKAAVVLMARQVYSGAPHDGSVSIRVEMTFARPQRLLTKKAPVGQVPYTRKPDVDNLLKGLQDALNGVLWTDDAKIFSADIRKYYVALGQPAETQIIVTLWSDEP